MRKDKATKGKANKGNYTHEGKAEAKTKVGKNTPLAEDRKE